jgi:uncharacterized damage-inducible protein DinB
MLENFRMFAAYNRWANGRILEAVSTLTGDEYHRDCGAFFKSMHGTLNHVLVADRIWLNRYTGEGVAPTALDQILCEEFPDLQKAREDEDARIVDWIGSLTEDDIAGTFTYTPITNPVPVTQRLAPALAHFFNHQTHHRGHMHMILTVLGKDAPPLDLIYFQRTAEGKQYA